jgi:hypothetical protein
MRDALAEGVGVEALSPGPGVRRGKRTPPDGGGSDAQDTSPSLRGSIKAGLAHRWPCGDAELGFGEESEWAGAMRTLGGVGYRGGWCLYDRIHARMRSFTARGRSTCRK